MSKINVDTWEPESGSAATLMATGDTVTVPSGASLVVASGATINITDATQTGFPSSGFNKYTVVVASDATFDLQSGTTKLIIEVQASGGTAGTSTSGWHPGGAGGGGAYARKLLSPMVDTDTLNITLGAVAGIAATGTTTSVASASGTSFTTITCDGGDGGTTSASAAYNGYGGAGGTVPTTGDFNVAGGSGQIGLPHVNSGQGGAWLARQSELPSAGVGRVPVGYGGGGGSGEGASVVGGAGGAAVVIVTEYK
jgi:hypothetical protein